MSVVTYSKTGSKSSAKTILPKTVFGVEVKNQQTLKQVYEAESANARTNNANTLTRGLVRGGGKKPWRQKGTGRARAGSIRSPIWRGGGITFGPSTNKSFAKNVNVKTRKSSLRQALSLKSNDNEVFIIEDFMVASGRTNDAAKIIDKLELATPLLIVLHEFSQETKRSVNNLPGVSLINVSRLNTSDVLNAKTVLFGKKTLDVIKARLEEKS